MILISVKYHSATNRKGSRWTATMQDGVVDGLTTKLRATVSYDHGNKDKHDGRLEACLCLIRKWDAKHPQIIISRGKRSWKIKQVGEDHRHEYIFTAYADYEDV